MTNPPRTPLTLSTKLAFGAGDLGSAMTANILAFFLLVFLTNTAGLDPGLAGSVLLISKIWDGVSDPVMGFLSDQTRHPWGRRYPWMIYGAVPFGVFFFLQWLVPPLGTWGLFSYYVLMGLLFHAFYTIVNLPYTALTPELTQDYHERTNLNSFRFAFSIGGSIFSLLLAQVIFSIVQGSVQRYLVLGAVCAVISVLPLFWCVAGTWQRTKALGNLGQNQQESPPSPIPFLEQLKVVFSNRPFLFVIGIYLCSWFAVQGTAAILPFFVVNWMGLPEKDFIQVALAVQIPALMMLFFWSALSTRVGKKAVYFLGLCLWLIAQTGLLILQPGQVGFMYVLAIIAGSGISTAYLVPWSMLPDVIELDELQTGQRREGLFYAFILLLQKIGLALGLFLIGQVLQMAGFIHGHPGGPPPLQPASALLAIRIAIGPIPMVALGISLVLAYFYPITREFHAQVLLQLARRRQESAP